MHDLKHLDIHFTVWQIFWQLVMGTLKSKELIDDAFTESALSEHEREVSLFPFML